MQKRIEKIMKSIEKNNLDGVALIAGPNMRYLTGANFHLMERPTVLILSKNYKPVAIWPNLEVDSFKSLNFEIIETFPPSAGTPKPKRSTLKP